MAPPRVRDIMAFHSIDRLIYDKFISLGTRPDLAKNVVCLFMWLEQIGFDIVTRLSPIINNPSYAILLITETETILHCLRLEDGLSSVNFLATPLMSALCGDNVDIRFFDYLKDEIVKGMVRILDVVGRVIFDDNLYDALQMYDESVVWRARMEARRYGGIRARDPPLPPELAQLWDPDVASVSTEDERSMFITFSKGFPITRQEIADYFNERWGDCITMVMMERTPAGGQPMYGRIIFKSESFIHLVLNGERVLKFTINGRQLWARKYVPRYGVSGFSPI